jgi:hypothetical protein
MSSNWSPIDPLLAVTAMVDPDQGSKILLLISNKIPDAVFEFKEGELDL